MSPLSCQPAGRVGTGSNADPVSGALSDARIAQLAADHQAAAVAVCAPDVAADLAEAVADTARHLGLNPNDPRAFTALPTLATRSYAHGHMDGAGHEREAIARTPLALLLNGRTR